MLPLIIKQWARVLSGPSLAWNNAKLWVGYHQRPDPAAILMWFIHRPGYVSIASRCVNPAQFHALHCRATYACHVVVCKMASHRSVRHLDILQYSAHDIPALVIGAVTKTQAASLQSVDVSTCGQIFTSREAAVLVSSCRNPAMDC